MRIWHCKRGSPKSATVEKANIVIHVANSKAKGFLNVMAELIHYKSKAMSINYKVVSTGSATSQLRGKHELHIKERTSREVH